LLLHARIGACVAGGIVDIDYSAMLSGAGPKHREQQ
jgi:hypothetical protein